MPLGGLHIFLFFPLSQAICPSGFFHDALFDKCYYWNETKQNFFDADQHCASLNAHLASIENNEENYFLSGVAREGDSPVWIGLNNYTHDFWSWIGGDDSKPVYLKNRDSFETKSEEKCASLNSSRDWLIESCYNPYPFLCSVKPLPSTTESTVTSTTATSTPSTTESTVTSTTTTSTPTTKTTAKPVQTTTKGCEYIMTLSLFVWSCLVVFQ